MDDARDYKGKYIFTWIIENFCSYFIESQNSISSPVFTIEPFENTKWIVEVTYKNVRFNQGKVLSCFLRRIEDDSKLEKIKIICSAELIGSIFRLFKSVVALPNDFIKGDRVEVAHFAVMNNQIKNNENTSGDILTIRLEMTRQEANNTKDTECIARTKVGGDRCCFEWKFEPSKLPLVKSFESYHNMQIKLAIVSVVEDTVRVQFKTPTRNSESRFIQCAIFFIGPGGTKTVSKSYSGWFLKNTISLNFNLTVDKNFLRSQCASNESVTLMCDCQFSNGSLLSQLKYVQHDEHVDSTVNVLQGDFQRMYLEQILSDVQLRVGKDTFYAHKCVLCARSPVFLAMFNQDMVENRTNFVDVSDVDSKTFGLFLKFLYIGDLEFVDCNTTLKLLLCADKYQVDSLKVKCSSFLMTDLCETNACKILVVANMVDQKLLKSSAIRRVMAHASRILKSADWMNVIEHHAKLASEVLSMMSADLGN